MAKTKKWLIWIGVIALLIGCGVWYVKSKKPVTTYTTADVTRGNLAQTVSVTGDINPQTQFNLGFEIGGMLQQVTEVGTSVASGQRVASLDKDSLILQSQVAQKDIDYQRKILSNMKKNTDTYTKQQRSAQQALVEKAQLSQSLASKNISDADIISPVTGIVTKKNVEVGETVVPSSTVLSVATHDLMVESKVPESDIAKVQLGQHANITLDALPLDVIFDSEIIQIDPASTVVQDVVYYNIKLKLENMDERIKPGMSANIDIKTAEKDDVLMIPLRAVKTEGSQKTVDVLQADNTVKTVKVETGLQGDDGMVEVTKGLNARDKVVTFVATK